MIPTHLHSTFIPVELIQIVLSIIVLLTIPYLEQYLNPSVIDASITHTFPMEVRHDFETFMAFY